MKSSELAERIAEAQVDDGPRRAPGRSDRGEERSLLLFRAAALDLALELTDVAELLVPASVMITPLPNLDLPFLGVTRRLGKVIPLADLALLAGSERAEPEESRRFMICHHPSGAIGFAVGQVEGIHEVSTTALGSLAPGSWSGGDELVTAMVSHDGHEHAILDVRALWSALRRRVPARESLK